MKITRWAHKYGSDTWSLEAGMNYYGPRCFEGAGRELVCAISVGRLECGIKFEKEN